MSGARPPRSDADAARRARLRMALRVGGSLALLALLFTVLPAADLVAALRAVPAYAWPIAVGGYLAFHLIGVAKWRTLVNAAGAGLGGRPATMAYYWGLFGNLFLPSIVGGDLIRAGVAFRHARSKSALVLGSVVDRVQDVVGLGVLAGAGALMSPRALDEGSRRVFLMLVALLAFGGIGVMAAARLAPVRRFPFKVRRKLVQVRRAMRAAAQRPGALARAFAAGLALQSLFIVLNAWLGRSIGIDIPLYVWFFAWPLAKISGLLPVTQGGIGVREAAQAALLAPFGVPAVKAVATGLVFEVVILSGGLLSGGLALLLGVRAPQGTESRADVRAAPVTGR